MSSAYPSSPSHGPAPSAGRPSPGPSAARPRTARLTPLLYAWDDLPAAQRRLALDWAREGRRQRRAGRLLFGALVLLAACLLLGLLLAGGFVLVDHLLGLTP